MPNIGLEIGNALSRLQADRPKLAEACEPAEVAKVVSAVLTAIDQTARQQFGLWTLEDRRSYLKVWDVLRPDGVDIGMRSTINGGGGYQREPAPWVERTKRKEELLQLPWVMELIQRVVLHTYQLLREKGASHTELNPHGTFPHGTGYARIRFFMDD